MNSHGSKVIYSPSLPRPVFGPIRTGDFLSGDDAAVGGAVPTCRPSHCLSREPEVGGADPL